jgi:hypothetical protein
MPQTLHLPTHQWQLQENDEAACMDKRCRRSMHENASLLHSIAAPVVIEGLIINRSFATTLSCLLHLIFSLQSSSFIRILDDNEN